MKYFPTVILLPCFLVVLTCCTPEENPQTKNPILLADREAPLGWLHLRIYDDSTFEFESRGTERNGNIYSGTVNIKTDTLFFDYIDSIPAAGKTAVYDSARINYIDGKYSESLQITLNKISK